MATTTTNISQSPTMTTLAPGQSPLLVSSHDHILPPGWSCKYDPKTSKYYFINDPLATSYSECKKTPQLESRLSSPHSSPTRMSSSVHTVISSKFLSPMHTAKHKIAATNEDVKQIYQQFPNVEEAYINHLMRVHHNRKNLVISALLSDGHSRTNFVLDESLFYKLRSLFPNVEPEVVRKLLIKNENKEHDTIESILRLFGLFNTTRYEYSQCPQLKLKYLKFAYPHVDEVILLDLLFNNDNSVNKVINHLKNIGYQTSELKIKFSKISETALIKEASARLNALRPTVLSIKQRRHLNLAEQEIVRKQITKQYQQTSPTLINNALEASNFDLDLAKCFLDSMTPPGSANYLVRTLEDREVKTKKFVISRQTQTNSRFQDLFGISTEATEQSQVEIDKKDNSTCTKEDGIIQRKITKLAIGPQKTNRKGPSAENRSNAFKQKLCSLIERKGPDHSLRRKPEEKVLRSLKNEPKGPQKENRKEAIGKQILRIKDQNKNEFVE